MKKIIDIIMFRFIHIHHVILDLKYEHHRKVRQLYGK